MENVNELLLGKLNGKSVQQALYELISSNPLEVDTKGLLYEKKLFKLLTEYNNYLTRLINVGYLQLVTAFNEETNTYSKVLVNTNGDTLVDVVKKDISSYISKFYGGEYNKARIKSNYYYHSPAKVSRKMRELTEYLYDIPYVINTKFLRYKRILKNGENESLEETELFKLLGFQLKDTTLHFNYEFDTRGRIYPTAYGINPNGEQWSKALVSFKNAYKISSRDELKWIRRDLANNYGLDLDTNENKDKWFYKNIDSFKNVTYSNKLVKKAKKPLLFYKALLAFRETQLGNGISHGVALDACSSGLQILAILSGDKRLAKITNLTSDSYRYDYYTEVINKFNEICGLNGMPRLKNPRSLLKKPIMTHWYNSVANVRKVFDSINNGAKYYQYFLLALEEKSYGASQVKAYLNDFFKKNLSGRDSMCYVMPDGFEVYIPFYNTKSVSVESKYYKVQYTYKSHEYSYQENFRAFVPNIIHSIDAYICREMIRKAKEQGFEILTNHDSFSAHPKDCDRLLENYNDILCSISNSDILKDILEQIVGRRIENYPFVDKIDVEELKKSKYSIC